MEPRNRGRAKGARPRGGGPYPPPGQLPSSSGAHSSHQQPAAPQGAWGRPAPSSSHAPPAPNAWIRPPAQPSQQLGRGSRQGGGDQPRMETDPPRALVTATSGEGDGNGNGARGGGNGGVRGRSNRFEILRTKPAQLENKKGTSGQVVRLSANYFEVTTVGKWCLYQYRVDFAPEDDNTGRKKGHMRTAMQGVIQGGYLFDGTCLYTPTKLHNTPLELFVAGEGDERIRITVRLVGDLVWGDSHYFQLFNLIIRKCLCYLKLHEIKRKYYDPSLRVSIQEHCLILWPGFTTSIRQHERKILLNVDLAFKVMRTDTVLDLLHELGRRGGNVKRMFADAVIGTVVLTRYNNKTYRIDDVSFEENAMSTFQLKDGSSQTFKEYFEKKYREQIRDNMQPLLISRSKPREIRAGMPETVKLIPELCIMTGLSDMQRDNMELMRAMAKHTRINPAGRVERLMRFMGNMLKNTEAMQEVKRWDLNFANRLIEFEGRVLPPEKLHLGGNKATDGGQNADWTNAFRNMSMFSTGTMNNLVIICPRRMQQDLDQFLKTMQQCARGLDWRLPRPKILMMEGDRVDHYVQYLEKAVQENPTLIICCVFRKATDIYTAIKKKSYVDRGIPTQVITKRSLAPMKGGLSIATKILIQMNCKIGGAPWSVSMPLTGLMICGYDVCRDTAQRGKSFGAVVSSMDAAGTRYFSSVSEHKTEEELSNNFGSNVLAACNKYKDINGNFPDKILIYRDGVGDGQLPYVYNHEVMHIKKMLSENVYRANNLKMAFVVVSKRINTKIFAGTQNPRPGTVVDDVITLPERYDFFIVSQCVNQGTVGPTSYNIIEDTMGLSPDKMQILTYKLCHMYYNWSGTVRVPAPCQYAHRLSQLVSQCLHRAPHQNLKNLLYFL